MLLLTCSVWHTTHNDFAPLCIHRAVLVMISWLAAHLCIQAFPSMCSSPVHHE